MKLLLLFVSALVLVAHGNVNPSEEEDSVYTIKPGVVASYADNAGQEADDAGQEADDVEDTVVNAVPASETGVYIPSVARACTNAVCANICHRLGFKYGQCTSPSTCWCHN